MSTIVIGLFTAVTTLVVLYLIARASHTERDNESDQ